MRTGRPLVTLKGALTLDGKIAAPEDEATPGQIPWITSATAREHVQLLRHSHDAILTGIGTVLADDCRLTDRTGEPRSRPLLRIVLDSLLRLPLDSSLVRPARTMCWRSPPPRLRRSGASVWRPKACAWR